MLAVPAAAQHDDHGNHPGSESDKSKHKITVPTSLGAQTICPVSGEELEDKDNFVDYEGHRMYLCCKKCKKKASADPAKYLDIMEGRTAQEKCAVKGGDLDAEASFVLEGFTVGQCCEGCEKKWEVDPASNFAKLEKDNVVLEPVTMKCPVMPGMNGNKKFPVTLGAKRYYLCSNKAAMMFVLDPAKYLPNWYKAQGIEEKMPGHGDGHEGGHGNQ